MTTKEIAKNTIDKLPNEVNFEDIINAIYIQAKFEYGFSEINNGNGIPNDEAKNRLLKWVK